MIKMKPLPYLYWQLNTLASFHSKSPLQVRKKKIFWISYFSLSFNKFSPPPLLQHPAISSSSTLQFLLWWWPISSTIFCTIQPLPFPYYYCQHTVPTCHPPLSHLVYTHKVVAKADEENEERKWNEMILAIT